MKQVKIKLPLRALTLRKRSASDGEFLCADKCS